MDTALAIAFGIVSLVLAGVVWKLSSRAATAEALAAAEKERADKAQDTADRTAAQLASEREQWNATQTRLNGINLARGAEIARLMRSLNAHVDPADVRARLDGLSHDAGARPVSEAGAGPAVGPGSVPPRGPAST